MLYQAKAAEGELAELILAKALNWSTRADRDRFDLLPFYAILCSAGWNKNTDVFDPGEMWDARKSPIDKPVNIGHKAPKIIGHIVDVIAVGEDLQPIKEDTEKGDLPYKMHLVIAAVAYKYFDDVETQAEVNEVLDRISKGDIYCSMECLFKNFDYALMDAKGEQKIIPRNTKTVGLTKYLRQYKGPGKIHDRTIGRLLKDITFSAVGIVEKPANPDSIISAKLDLFSANSSESSVYITLDKNNGEINMSEDTTKADVDTSNLPNVEDHPKYQALHNEHSALKHAHEALVSDHNRLKTDHGHLHNRVEDLNKKLDDVHKKTLAEEAAKAMTSCDSDADADDKKSAADMSEEDESAMAALKAENASLKQELETIKAEKVSLATANDAMNATLEEFKKASRDKGRAEELMNADATYTKESAMQAIAKNFNDMSDSTFAAMIEVIKGYAGKAPKEVTPQKLLDNARAEVDVPCGGPVVEINKAAADIATWLKNTKPKSKSQKVEK